MSTFPPDLEAYVELKIQSGAFNSREEFEVEAFRAYRHLEEQRKQLKADIDAALDESRKGHVAELDIEAIKQELIDELDEQGNPR